MCHSTPLVRRCTAVPCIPFGLNSSRALGKSFLRETLLFLAFGVALILAQHVPGWIATRSINSDVNRICGPVGLNGQRPHNVSVSPTLIGCGLYDSYICR